MKCLLKTVISLVVIILIAAAVMYFWGIPTLLGEDNATEHLEKQGYTVVVTDISLTEGCEAQLYAEKDETATEDTLSADIVLIWYFEDGSAARDFRSDYVEEMEEQIDYIADGLNVVRPGAGDDFREEAETIKVVRFGKIVIQGTVRGILAAITGL